MKRRDFLAAVLCAPVIVPVITQAARKRRTAEYIYQGLLEIAEDYQTQSPNEQAEVIADLDRLILKLRGQNAKDFISNYRNALVSSSGIGFQQIEKGGAGK